MIINGTADQINPNDGGLVVLNGDSSRGTVWSSRETMQYWVDLLPCHPVPEYVHYDSPPD